MAASLPNANDLTQRFALDVQGFDALREQAKQSPRAGAKAVAGQFDAMFTQMMLKSMRDASPDGGLFDSHTSKMYVDARPAARAAMSTRGIGVADALMKQLLRNAGRARAAIRRPTSARPGWRGRLRRVRQRRWPRRDERDGEGLRELGQQRRAAGTRGYSAGSALTPPLKGASGVQDADAFVDRLARAGGQRVDRHPGALHRR